MIVLSDFMPLALLAVILTITGSIFLALTTVEDIGNKVIFDLT